MLHDDEKFCRPLWEIFQTIFEIVWIHAACGWMVIWNRLNQCYWSIAIHFRLKVLIFISQAKNELPTTTEKDVDANGIGECWLNPNCTMRTCLKHKWKSNLSGTASSKCNIYIDQFVDDKYMTWWYTQHQSNKSTEIASAFCSCYQISFWFALLKFLGNSILLLLNNTAGSTNLISDAHFCALFHSGMLFCVRRKFKNNFTK